MDMSRAFANVVAPLEVIGNMELSSAVAVARKVGGKACVSARGTTAASKPMAEYQL